MRVVITGINGFLGKNLAHYLSVRDIEVIGIARNENRINIKEKVSRAEIFIHLAGVNRTSNPEDFRNGNEEYLKEILSIISELNNWKGRIIYISSTQAGNNSLYGKSKLESENLLTSYGKESGLNFDIIRIPNVFGKWSKPFYNSVVATFCYQIINNLPLTIDEPNKVMSLIHVDKFCEYIREIFSKTSSQEISYLQPAYHLTVAELAEKLKKLDTEINLIPNLKDNLDKELHSVLVSYLDFKPKNMEINSDSRGDFIEILKLNEFNQISYLYCKSGEERGNHFHHTKVEVFFLLSELAEILEVDLITNNSKSIELQKGDTYIARPGVVHTIRSPKEQPSQWLIWANELYQPNNADTFKYRS